MSIYISHQTLLRWVEQDSTRGSKLEPLACLCMWHLQSLPGNVATSVYKTSPQPAVSRYVLSANFSPAGRVDGPLNNEGCVRCFLLR